jgi:hypothetical protein
MRGRGGNRISGHLARCLPVNRSELYARPLVVRGREPRTLIARVRGRVGAILQPTLLAIGAVATPACTPAPLEAHPTSASELMASARDEEARASTAPADEARRLLEDASRRRETAQQLSAIATSACAQLPEVERDRPSLLQPDAIATIRPAMGERRLIKTSIEEVRGAEIALKATNGMTKQWVARVVRCYLAWRDVTGRNPQDSASDPFIVGSPEVSFGETETGFVVRIVGRDKSQGEEILRRAQRFTQPPADPSHSVTVR